MAKPQGQAVDDFAAMSINGWIKLLSVIFKADVSNRLDSVAIDYEALNDVLSSLDPREARVIQLTIGDGKLCSQVAKEHRVSRERIRQIRDKGVRKLRHPMRVKMLHRAISGWWNITERTIPTSQAANCKTPATDQQAESTSCLVVMNFNKPRVRTKQVTVEVEKRVEVPGERVYVQQQPMWKKVSDGFPIHSARIFVCDWEHTETQDGMTYRGPMWFATYDKLTNAFVCNDGVARKTITHWCELPVLQENPNKRWDKKIGAFVPTYSAFSIKP